MVDGSREGPVLSRLFVAPGQSGFQTSHPDMRKLYMLRSALALLDRGSSSEHT
jgi:hypothetical protein